SSSTRSRRQPSMLFTYASGLAAGTCFFIMDASECESLLLQIPRGQRSRPIAWHVVFLLQRWDHVIRLLFSRTELLQHRFPVREFLASLFDDLFVIHIPIIGFH